MLRVLLSIPAPSLASGPVCMQVALVGLCARACVRVCVLRGRHCNSRSLKPQFPFVELGLHRQHAHVGDCIDTNLLREVGHPGLSAVECQPERLSSGIAC